MIDILEPPSLARCLGQVPVSFGNTDDESWPLWVERELKHMIPMETCSQAPDLPSTGHMYFQSGQQGPVYPVSETLASANAALVSSGPCPLSCQLHQDTKWQVDGATHL